MLLLLLLLLFVVVVVVVVVVVAVVLLVLGHATPSSLSSLALVRSSTLLHLPVVVVFPLCTLLLLHGPQLKGIPTKYSTFHLDVVTGDGFSHRFSFSNVFRAARMAGRVAQVPTM
jgi:hypothetical protein